MGWFDDDDDSDGEGRRKRPLKPFETFDTPTELPTRTNTSNFAKKEEQPQDIVDKDEEEAEEEDPLDAYMKSLSSSSSKGAAAADADKKKGYGRLDMDNEEEATAHWKLSSTKTVSSSIENEKEDFFSTADTINMSNSSSSLKESESSSNTLSKIFHKAGEAAKKTPSSNLTDGNCFYDEDDEIDSDINMQAIMEQKRKRDIDPLEKMDHSNKKYSHFRKCLLSEQNRQFQQGKLSSDADIDSNTVSIQSLFSDKDSNCLLPPEILAYLEKNKYQMATPVQLQSIPVALTGKDMLVTSPTGSGKTLAFSLPMICHVLDQPKLERDDGPISIVLTPTRELAKQVNIVCKKILQTVGGTSICIAGGMQGTYEISKELKKGCDVVISTPGRFIDMVKRKATNCDRTTLVVLDEFDKLLAMGFEQQVGSILNYIRPDRQTFMFSATYGSKLQRVSNKWLHDDFARIAIGAGLSSEHVAEHVFVMPDSGKKQWIIEMLPIFAEIGRSIVFVASRVGCEELKNYVNSTLGSKGITVESIHGDKHQSDRNASLAALKKGKVSALVATDVAARGLDVTDIMTVINFDAANNLDSHVHRIGRAGRLSGGNHKKGNAYTLLSPKNVDFAAMLVESFRKEGKEIPNDLIDLASKSHRQYGSNSSARGRKKGLGY